MKTKDFILIIGLLFSLPVCALTSDGSVVATNQPSYLSINRAPYTIRAKFQNLGTDTITSLYMNYAINGTTITQNFSGLSIPTGVSNWFEFTTPYTPSVMSS